LPHVINGLSHYGGVICYVYITSLEMCAIEVMPLVFVVVHYIVP